MKLSFKIIIMSLFLVFAGQGAAYSAEKVRLAEPFSNLIYMPAYVAYDKGFFKENGLNVELISTGRGSGPRDLLISKDVEFGVGGLAHPVQMHLKGFKAKMIALTNNRVTMNVIMGNQWLERTGIKPDSAVKDKLKALKGATIGIASFGGYERLVFLMLLKVAGMDPDKDVKWVNIGDITAMAGAMKVGQIDMWATSPPRPQLAEKQGIGKVIIQNTSGEVPELGEMLFAGYYTRQDLIDTKPQTVRAFASAIAKAGNWIHSNPVETKDLMRKRWAKEDPKFIDQLVDIVIPSISKDGSMTKAGYEKHINALVEAKIVEKYLSYEEVVTNEFLRK